MAGTEQRNLGAIHPAPPKAQAAEAKATEAQVAATQLSTTELLQLLRQHSGREYQVLLLRPAPLEATCYLFAYCSRGLQATGPSQQTRLLSAEQFTALFGKSTFVQAQPTGRLTDLGPLFESTPFTLPFPTLDTD